MLNFQSEQFNGPLDLLLSLIQEKKLPISQIALATVTEQFLAYLEGLDEDTVEPSELADFLMVAARLVLLKSSSMVPHEILEEDGPTLEAQLRLYQAFVEASKLLNRKWLAPNRAIFRVEPMRQQVGFVAPQNATKETLNRLMWQVINRLAPPKPLPKTTIDSTVSLKEKISTLRSILQKTKRVLFHETLLNLQSRTEIIVSFLALLELMKQDEATIEQEIHFGDILLITSAV